MRRLVVGLAIGLIAGLATPAAFADKQQDQQIASHIFENLGELKQQGHLRGFDVRMRVSNGTVWLTGHTASESQRKLVLDVAARTKHLGTVQVVNDIKVQAADSAKQPTAAQPVAEQVTESASRKGLLSALGISLGNPLRHSAAGEEEGDVTNAVALEENTPAIYRHPQSTQNSASTVSVLQASESSRRSAPAPLANTEAQPQAIGTGAQPHVAMPAPQGDGYVRVPAHVLAQLMARPQAGQSQTPMAFAPAMGASYSQLQPIANGQAMSPMPAHLPGAGVAAMPAQHDNPTMPGYAWPSYAAHPNYAALTYPKQYSPTAWPYIGPYYPYPQVPLAWRKVTLEWKDGWWFLDFKSR